VSERERETERGEERERGGGEVSSLMGGWVNRDWYRRHKAVMDFILKVVEGNRAQTFKHR